jgi:protein-tyrosine phosphatase
VLQGEVGDGVANAIGIESAAYKDRDARRVPGPDEHVIGPRRQVDEVPGPEPALLFLHEEQALAGEDEDGFLVPLTVVVAVRLPWLEHADVDADVRKVGVALEAGRAPEDIAPHTPARVAGVQDEPALALRDQALTGLDELRLGDHAAELTRQRHRVGEMFVDVHSHVIPSGDDGAPDVVTGLELCREAARRGTSVLYGTPHIWPHLVLTEERERDIRAAYAKMSPRAVEWGLELRLGFELTPTLELLEADLSRYLLDGTRLVLVELPFSGPLELVERIAERADECGITPLLAHPERADAVISDPLLTQDYCARGWLLQVNATSLLGRHGPEREETGWLLVERGLASVVASDGHRLTRPPFLDAAYDLVKARVGEAASDLFDGSGLRPAPTPVP